MKTKQKIVVITGAESTGKSTLTEALSNYFNVPYLPEIAREYVEKLNRKYTYYDVEQIAKLQTTQFRNILQQNAPYVFIDTWLIITKIWFEFVYNKVPSWITEEIKNTKIDLFLVCDIDLPWVSDPVRENGGENRKILQMKYIENINHFGFRYNIVSGYGDMRLKNALNFIKELE